MANEIIYPFIAGQVSYFLVLDNKTGKVWNNSGAGAFETYSASNFSGYAVTVVELGASPIFEGSFPTGIPAGSYGIVALNRLGTVPAESDTLVAAGNVDWNGVQPASLTDFATSGQISQLGPVKIARGVMVQNFGFKMVSSTDHVTNFVSGIVSGQIARDGGSFTALQSGSIVETGLGWYNLVALTSGDLLASTAKLAFTANGISGGTSDQRDFFFVLQKVSGSV